ncbi:30S ribosomal protein S8 [Candidatus Babeliales bacterium]|nr:30S ribosomal protein S8 [Candidatus Babeliales bacterium]
MSIDVIGDFLTVIRNALSVSKRSVVLPYSKMKENVALVLKEEGYIRDFRKIPGEKVNGLLQIDLKYIDGESVIHEVKRVSRPGKRCYMGSSKIEAVIGGLGIAIITTSAGIMTDRRARQMSVGGEVICSVW